MGAALSPPEDVRAALSSFGASSETIDRLSAYAEILERWRSRINLIGPATIDDVWRRHILDSAQAWRLLDQTSARIVDLGSGAGLPGLIIAILGAENVTLVDSDQRKCVFLREAARAAGVSVIVKAARFEPAFAGPSAGAFQVATGRAVAPLPRLLPTLAAALAPGGYALLHKGENVEKELTEAQKSWSIQTAEFPSIVGSGGVLLKIWGIERHA